MILLRFASEFFHMMARGMDMAIEHLAPVEGDVQVYRFWEDSNA